MHDEHGACWDCRGKYISLSKLFKAEYILMQEEDIFTQDEKFTWGGDWTKFNDLPHFQIND